MEPLTPNLQSQCCSDTEGYNSHSSQWHSGALAKGQDIKKDSTVDRWPEGSVKELQQHEGCAQTGQLVRGSLGTPGRNHSVDVGTQRAVEAKTEAEQGPSVPEEAGQRTGVHADPLCSLAPAQGFLHTPEKVDAYQLKEQIQKESQGEQERGGQQVGVQVGRVDLLGPAQRFGHQDT